jgi:CheY-like chemotaxis protein
VRVLVIDDNPANLELAVYLLRAFGHEVEERADGTSGLEAARSGRFSIVLTDLLMPGIDGYEFARRFKSDPHLSSTRLIALTALAMGADSERIAAAGFDGCITKPIDPERFVAEVESYLLPSVP